MISTRLETISDEEIRQSEWYYQVELRRGVSTHGSRRGSLSLVRKQLELIDLTGQRCLDVGTQEGVTPTVLARSGAAHVVAYDRLDLSDRIALVQEAYGVRFNYMNSFPLSELPARLAGAGEGPFDVVVFAGVLYHMLDPLGGLGLVRGLVRENGLLIVETSALCDDDLALQLNAAGRYYQGSNYFQITTSALDYCLRMLRLQVLDCRHISRLENRNLCRVSLVCRAVGKALPLTGDTWMNGHWIPQDFGAVSLDFANVQSDAAPVKLSETASDLVFHRGMESADVTRSVRSTMPFHVNAKTSVLTLN